MYSVQIMTNLIFLHGLLGTKSDWQKVIENLPHFRCLSLDLPFHGENKAVAVEDFEQTAQFLESQIQSLIKDEPYSLSVTHLVGELHNIMLAGSSAKRQFTSSDFRRGEFRFAV